MFKKQLYILLGFWTLLKILSVFQSYFWLKSIGINRSMLHVATSQGGSWLLGLIFLYLLAKTFQNFLNHQKPWYQHVFYHIAGILGFTLTMSVSPFVVYALFENIDFTPQYFQDVFLSNLPSFSKDATITYFLFIAMTYALTYFYRKRDDERKLVQTEKLLLQTRLLYLKSQLHPHFLFNTLNAISTLMETNLNSAREMLVDLSDLLRAVLDYDDKNKISLQEELHILDKYLNIELIRFSDSLEVHKKIADQTLSLLIPAFVLQPMAENSIKHGSGKEGVLKITIAASIENEWLLISIVDNGPGLNPPITEGTGLKNIKSRLQTLYGNEFEFTTTNNESGGVINKLKIPKEVV